MSPLKLEGASQFYVIEAHRIEGVKARRKLGKDEVIVPDGGVLDISGPLGDMILRGFKDGGVFNGNATLWEGDNPIVVERDETKVTITPTKEG